jgi:sigma-B regulation protein RsbU (phosphoserine phosphatase)
MTQSANVPLLLQLAEVANSPLDLDKVLERIAEIMRQLMECEIVAILLLDEASMELRVRHAIGLNPEMAASIRIPLGKGLTGAAAAARKPVLSNDVRTDGRYLAGPADVRAELAVPLMIRGRVVGVIDLQSIQPGFFTRRHRDLAMLAATRVAAAVLNARLYRSTLRQARVLAALAEINREFSSILQLGDLLRKVSESVRQLIPYDAFSVLLLDENEQALKSYLSVRATEVLKEKIRLPVGSGIVGHVAASRKSMLVNNVRQEPRYIVLNEATRSEMAVPLVAKGRVIGVLDLESTRLGFFTTRDLNVMEMLAPQVAIAIENARLYEELARDEARLGRDLAAARELQASLLPPCCPAVPGIELSARYEPARELGGDLYDFIEYDGQANPVAPAGALGIFIGDVSGKGSAAALYAALAHGLIRTLAQRVKPPAELLSKLNRVLSERRVEARSLALGFALLDLGTRTLEIASAGLPHPIFCRGGQVRQVETGGVPLGLLENVEYEARTVPLEPGDVAVFYSDGISENFNAAHEEYGRPRLRELISRNCRLGANELVGLVFEEMERWSAGMPPSDDRTVVVLKVAEEGFCQP